MNTEKDDDTSYIDFNEPYLTASEGVTEDL